MTIAADLRTVADRANRDLDAVHDFFEHSKTVWRSFQSFVSAGHVVSSVNSATGTAIDGAGLLRLAPQYTRGYLATFTFRQFVSTFESFFFAFFHRLLQHNPRPYGRVQLDFDAVLKARDRDEIIAGVLLKQLNELKYEAVRGLVRRADQGGEARLPDRRRGRCACRTEGHTRCAGAQRRGGERHLRPKGRQEGAVRGGRVRRDRRRLPPGELATGEEG